MKTLKTQEQDLAEALHKELCFSNHTDQCDWLYGSWEDPRFSRKQYLKKANAILKIIRFTDAKKVIEVLAR